VPPLKMKPKDTCADKILVSTKPPITNHLNQSRLSSLPYLIHLTSLIFIILPSTLFGESGDYVVTSTTMKSLGSLIS
jgi:hypothetical protein